MKREAPKAGDIVFIVSAIDNETKPNLGIGLLLELSSSIPWDCKEERNTCTLLWHGEIENDIDVEWIKTIQASD
jgi:hypothetical protein